jgi:DNA-binding PadR family transcriptional regulator
LRHALLGLLAEGPASGWDLSRRFDELLGAVWPAGHPQIYGELGRLHDGGLIALDSEGPRRRKVYRITAEGREAVHHWLTSVEVDHTMRLEPLLRSVFFWLLTPAELNEHVEREIKYYERLAETYLQVADAKDRGEYGHSPQTQSIRVAVEAGIRLAEALADWARWTQANLGRTSGESAVLRGREEQ